MQSATITINKAGGGEVSAGFNLQLLFVVMTDKLHMLRQEGGGEREREK